MENSYKTPAKLLIRRCKFRLDLGLFALVLTWLLAPLPPSPITFLSGHPGHTKLQPHLPGARSRPGHFHVPEALFLQGFQRLGQGGRGAPGALQSACIRVGAWV